MKPQKKWSATERLARLCLFLGLLLSGTAALAQQIAGTVTHLSGPLLARKADGTIRVLAQKSAVEQGDTLVTEKDTYARIRFSDSSDITLRPASQLKIDRFIFEEEQPEKDSAVFSLVKGGLRAVTGMLGKRSQEKFGLATPTATIGVRGTIFVAEYVSPQAPASVGPHASMQASIPAAPDAVLSPVHGTRSDLSRQDGPVDFAESAGPMMLAQESGAAQADGKDAIPSLAAEMRAPGLYVEVLDGMVNLGNGGGAQDIAAGQFGYAPTQIDPPVILPVNPGMRFTPPPSFAVSTGSQQGTPSASGTPGTVDCEVR
jgi:hypothetical protein